MDIQNLTIKKNESLILKHMRQKRSESARERRILLHKSDHHHQFVFRALLISVSFCTLVQNTKDDYRSELALSSASSPEEIIITWMKNKLHWTRQGRYKKMDKDRLQTGGLWHGTKC